MFHAQAVKHCHVAEASGHPGQTNKLAGTFGTASATLSFARAGKIKPDMAPAALASYVCAMALRLMAAPGGPLAFISK